MRTILKLHSAVDLITNSSTVIYTYSDGALAQVKEVVNEILKVFGESKTFDDLFYAQVFLESYQYTEAKDTPLSELDWKKKSKVLNQIMDDVLTSKIEKPDWMIRIEKQDSYDDYPPSSNLHLKAKDEKYSDLAKKLIDFLYSTSHEASYNG